MTHALNLVHISTLFQPIGIDDTFDFALLQGATLPPGASDWVYGDNDNNTMNGTANRDWINGEGGDDLINGLAGNDFLRGGHGDDTLVGGDGNDQLNGGPGNDSLDGDAGSNILFGGTGHDTINSTSGKDIVFGDRVDEIIAPNGLDAFVFVVNGHRHQGDKGYQGHLDLSKVGPDTDGEFHLDLTSLLRSIGLNESSVHIDGRKIEVKGHADGGQDVDMVFKLGNYHGHEQVDLVNNGHTFDSVIV